MENNSLARSVYIMRMIFCPTLLCGYLLICSRAFLLNVELLKLFGSLGIVSSIAAIIYTHQFYEELISTTDKKNWL